MIQISGILSSKASFVYQKYIISETIIPNEDCNQSSYPYLVIKELGNPSRTLPTFFTPRYKQFSSIRMSFRAKYQEFIQFVGYYIKINYLILGTCHKIFKYLYFTISENSASKTTVVTKIFPNCKK